jgi:hypothetical protein
MRRDVTVRTGVATLMGLVCACSVAWAGRPLAVDDADPADPGQCEVEAGVCYERTPDCTHWDYPVGAALGLGCGVEVGVGFGGQLEERVEVVEHTGSERSCTEHGVGDLVLGVKWRLINSCPLGARHALVPSVKFPTADDDKDLGNGETDYDLTWVVSRDLGEAMGVHANLGYSWIGGGNDDILHCGVAFDWRFADALQWVGEVFAEEELTGGAQTVAQADLGLRWTSLKCLTLDIAAGTKVSGEAPDLVVTAGLTWVPCEGGNGSDQEIE